MADVAARAGVSVMTVSRVLNDFPGVAEPTRRRVEKAITALGYQANTAARVLAGGRSRTIGVVAVETQQFGPAHMLFGIEAAAHEAGHLLTFVTLDGAGGGMGRTLERLRASHVEGVIVVAPVRGILDALAQVHDSLPRVVIGGDATLRAPTVAIDQREGARRATAHLLELGHATVHHVRGPRNWIDAAGRVRGWSDALRAAGARRVEPLTGDWGAAGGYAAGRRLAEDPEVTAVFAANDQTALGVLRALHDAGRRVPDDVSVVGFDDTPEAAYVVPALTTSRHDFAEVGRRCVDLLLSLADGAEEERHEIVPAELIVRESTAAPRAGGAQP
jgi:DNA-binding LacI/PurR family transcriptional regulator